MARFDFRVFDDDRVENPGEDIAYAIERYEAARDRETAREDHAEDREFLREQRSRDRVRSDLEFNRLLDEEGLERATPGFVEGPRASTELPPREQSVFADVHKATRDDGAIELRSAREDTSDVFNRDSVSRAFKSLGEAGPDAMAKPFLLPGQFASGVGFAKRPIFVDEFAPVNIPGAQDFRDRGAPDLRERVTLGDQEFVRTRPRKEDAAADRQATLVQQEIDALIEAGVPPSIAGFAQADPVLARQYLSPEEEPEPEEAGPQFTEKELVAAGLTPAMARLAMRDPDLVEGMIDEVMFRNRPQRTTSSGSRGPTATERRLDREIAQEQVEALVGQALRRTGGDRGVALDIVAEAVRENPELSGIFTPAMIEELVMEGAPDEEGGELDPATEERRDNIVRRLGSRNAPRTPWQQDVVDMLAGIGPGGEKMEPLTGEEILAGYQRAGTPEDTLRTIRSYLSLAGG